MPEPWPIPPIRAPLEMEAGLLDSDVQEPLGTEELDGDEVTGNLQLQWGTQTEFPSAVRLFELTRHGIPLTVVAGGGILECLQERLLG